MRQSTEGQGWERRLAHFPFPSVPPWGSHSVLLSIHPSACHVPAPPRSQHSLSTETVCSCSELNHVFQGICGLQSSPQQLRMGLCLEIGFKEVI